MVAADAELMRRALAQGDTARRRTAPNPWVGAVVVRDGEVVGEGATQPPGGAHAEIEALRSAGERARGATLYTTLEPCSHQGRTPPCAVAIAEAGVARVVVALQDPDRQVAGQGVAQLRDRGLTVELGVGADDAARALAPYLLQRRLGRAYTVVKTAMSLDGRIAARDGSSRWITGAASPAPTPTRCGPTRRPSWSGAGTALADRPSLTARDVTPPVAHQPLRVVLDATGRVTAEGPLFDAAAGAHAGGHHRGRRRRCAAGVAGRGGQGPDRAAGGGWHRRRPRRHPRGARRARCPPGAGGRGRRACSGSLVEAGLADRLVTYVAPTMLGRDGRPALDFAGPGPHRRRGALAPGRRRSRRHRRPPRLRAPGSAASVAARRRRG